jgi:hypothetical protein
MTIHGSSRRTAATKWLPAILTMTMLLSCHASASALKTIEWFNGYGQCRDSIKFDPKKYDEQRLRNTVDVMFTNGFGGGDLFPIIPLRPTTPVNVRLEQYQQLCEATIRRASELSVIDLPHMEAFRKLKIEVLEDRCRFGASSIRAAGGEPSALRGYAPSADNCLDFIEALEGKVDIMTFWRQFVYSNCRGNAWPDKCGAASFSHEGDADVIDRARWEIFHYGWNNCSTAYLKGNVDTMQMQETGSAREREFRRRFKIKSEPCSD